MYFPVSGVEIEFWIPPLISFLISMLTASGGISGAFILLPIQMSLLGFTSPAVSSTNQLYNIIAIPGGVWRYIKEGRMVWPLAWIVIIGTLPGVFLGAYIRLEFLKDPGNFKIFAGLILLYMGIKMISDMLKKGNKNNAEERFNVLVRTFKTKQEFRDMPRIKVNKFSVLKLNYEFYGEQYNIPVLTISLISFIVGIAGGIYGIGGGAIIAPIYVAFFGLPVYTVAGAALLGTFITSVAGVLFYQFLSFFYPGVQVAPDYMLGFLFGIGGLAGIYLGARFQKYMPARLIKVILVLAILFIAVRYIMELWQK